MSHGIFEAPSTGWLVPFLLLGLRERDHYGHELTQRIAGFESGSTRPGAIYRSPRQMEKEGMIVSEYDGFDGRLSWQRYAITEPGEAYLERWASSLAPCREKVDLLLNLYEGPTPGACDRGTGREER